DREWLDSLLRASLMSTVDYVQAKGVDVLAVDIGAEGCPYPDLSKAPEALTGDFAKMQGLVGQFLPAQDQRLQALPRPDQRGVILVKRAVDRWTLVHEFMHHNFFSHRKSVTPFDQ